MHKANPIRICAVSSLCAALAGCVSVAPNSGDICYQNPYFPNENHELVTKIATQTLADHGITVTDSFVTNKTRSSQNRRGPVLLPHEDQYITGYNVWSHVEQCSKGQVVVQLSAGCQVQQIYTRYGCEIPGLP